MIHKGHLVFLDSQCVTYLVRATDGLLVDISDEIRSESIAMLRILLYQDKVPFYSSTVATQCNKIPIIKLRDNHNETLDISLCEYVYTPDQLRDIKELTDKFTKYHSGVKNVEDCKILAEANIAKADYLLTYDTRLINHLKEHSDTPLLRPTEYWTKLNLPRTAKPIFIPHEDNPLSKEIFWRWSLTPSELAQCCTTQYQSITRYNVMMWINEENLKAHYINSEYYIYPEEFEDWKYDMIKKYNGLPI